MATLMQPLTSPEATWQRIEQDSVYIMYLPLGTTWTKGASQTGASGGTHGYTSTLNATAIIKFKGTKIRILSTTQSVYASQVQITIDGVSEIFSENTPSLVTQNLVYEKQGLSDAIHTVEIKAIQSGTTAYTVIDAIDIDSTGYLIAQVGQKLTSAENGWVRIDNTDANINYGPPSVTWNSATNAPSYNGNYKTSSTSGAFARFSFTGDRIRLISTTSSSFSTSAKIKIDGVEETFSLYSTSGADQVIVYEKTGLANTTHMVDYYHTDTSSITLDAIDIASGATLGTFVPSFLHPKTSIEDIQAVGDMINCEFVANTSGYTGMFSNLGTTTKSLIPSTPVAVPNGSFNFIYVGDDFAGRKLLMADRIIQTTIPWRYLNFDGIATFTGQKANKYFDYDSTIPVMTSNTQNGITLSYDNTAITGGSLINMFNGNQTDYLYLTATAPVDTGMHWIKIDYGTSPKQINAIYVQDYVLNGSSYGVKYWKLQGSNDDTTWTDIAESFHQNEKDKEFDEFENENVYRYYRFLSYAWNGTSVFGVSELQLFAKKPITKFDNYNLYIRLPKRAEYEKYILKNTIGGQTTVGDATVWNQISTNYSWMYDGYGSYRYAYGTTSTNVAPTTSATAYGFRPMLVVEETTPPISSAIKMLVQDGLNDLTSPIKKYNSTTNTWDTIAGLSMTTLTVDDFDTHGMLLADWNSIPSTAWDLLTSDARVRTYSPTGLSKNAKFSFVSDDKLVLMTTDYIINNAMNFDNFNVTATANGSAMVKFVVSPDSGLTWYSWNGTQWIVVNPTKADVSANGMTITQFNSMGNNIFDILTLASTIRFGCFISMTTTSEVAEVDTYSYQYDGYGKWQQAVIGTEYDVIYEYMSNLLNVNIYGTGDWKISYVEPSIGNSNVWAEFTI